MRTLPSRELDLVAGGVVSGRNGRNGGPTGLDRGSSGSAYFSAGLSGAGAWVAMGVATQLVGDIVECATNG